MAYDPNDAADVAIVTAAVTAERDRLTAIHEAEIEGLKDSNAKILARLKKARGGDGGGDNLAEIERLENELAETQGKLRKAESDLRQSNRDRDTAIGERDTSRTALQAEQDFSRNEIINSGLTSALASANVGPQFIDAAKSLLREQVVVREADGKRQAFVGDKPLGEFVKTWASGDQGKHFVVAPNNGGAGTQNGNGDPSGGAKKISEMTYTERAEHERTVGSAEFTRQANAEKAAAQAQ